MKADATALRLTSGQKLLAVLTLLVLLAMSYSTFNGSNVSSRHSKILDAAEVSSESIILVQREAIGYVVEVDQWLVGKSTRKSVESARALLARRLKGFDSSGTSITSLINPLFLQNLKAADAVVQKSPKGLLPIQIRGTLKEQMTPIVDNLTNFAAELVISFQKSIEAKLRLVTAERAKVTTRNLILRYLFLLMISVLLFWVGFTFSARYEYIKYSIKRQVDELDSSRTELEQAQALVTDLRILDEEKNEFISNINHELRTPLTSIIGYLGLVNDLTDEENSPQTAKFLEIVDRNVVLLLELVENMLTISKLDIQAPAKTYDRVILDEVIADTIFILQPSLDAAEISIHFAVDDSTDDWSVAGIKAQISQVFINLLENSLKFSPRNSKMNIEMSTVLEAKGAKFVRVSVADQGIGIPTENLTRLFERFYRAENAVLGQIPGTGLGLAIVKKIIEQHGGRVNIESEVNIGTTVHVDLPVFVSRIDQLVRENRLPVLEKAINSITNAPIDRLLSVAHEMGGTIGFYTFEREGEELLKFSRWLAVSPNLTEDEIYTKRDQVLVSLKTSLVKIELGLSN